MYDVSKDFRLYSNCNREALWNSEERKHDRSIPDQLEKKRKRGGHKEKKVRNEISEKATDKNLIEHQVGTFHHSLEHKSEWEMYFFLENHLIQPQEKGKILNRSDILKETGQVIKEI